MTRRVLTGWGRTPASASAVVAHTQDLPWGTQRGVLARGLGRSYGDAALNAGGTVVDSTTRARLLGIDANGRAHVEAGMSLDALLRAALPLGWFVPVTPGTRFVTVGGAIAADIHGKNHHVDGAFCDHVTSLHLDAPAWSGSLVPGDEAFAATAGGMGLTGIVRDAHVQLVPVQTARMLVDTERTNNLDDVMARMVEGDHRYRYSVAWIDLLARGRGVLTRGDHAPLAALDGRAARDPLALGGRQLGGIPDVVPRGLLNRTTVRAFNLAWWAKAPRERRDQVQSIPAFFHPLDAVADWNRIYGPRGFVQYQVAVPDGAEEALRRLAARLADASAPSFLTVLKRFGPGRGLLSFPMAGWTLALDIPAGTSGLAELLDRCDADVAAAGGRVYLAKDARVRPDVLAAMYPELAQWRTIRDSLDPEGRVRSDLGRRLGLIPAGEPETT